MAEISTCQVDVPEINCLMRSLLCLFICGMHLLIGCFILQIDTESLTHGQLDKTSLRTMLAVLDYLRRQKRPIQGYVLRGKNQGCKHQAPGVT